MPVEVNEGPRNVDGILRQFGPDLLINRDLAVKLPELVPLGAMKGFSIPKREVAEHFTSFRDELLPKLSDRDINAIKGLLDSDQRLERFGDVFEKSPGMDKPQQRARHIRDGIGSVLTGLESERPDLKNLSVGGREGLATFVQFYHCYLTPFPDKTETEAATSLFELASGKNDPNKWDVVMNRDQYGNILAASSGQLINGDTLWGEHAWRLQDPSMRGSRAGTNVIQEFMNKFIPRGAQRMMVEVDNPFALSEDAKAHDMVDVAGRRDYWAQAGQSMDPYDRQGYHNRTNELRLIVKLVEETGADGRTVIRPVAVNNSQIALEGNDEGCRTIIPCVRTLTDGARSEGESLGASAKTFLQASRDGGVAVEGIDIADIKFGMGKATFSRAYAGMQATIDGEYGQRPEYKDAMADLQDAHETLIIVDPLSKTGLAAQAARAEDERRRAGTGEA
jgi:hypothetical protein